MKKEEEKKPITWEAADIKLSLTISWKALPVFRLYSLDFL